MCDHLTADSVFVLQKMPVSFRLPNSAVELGKCNTMAPIATNRSSSSAKQS